MKILTHLKLDNIILGVITKVSIKNTLVLISLSICAKYSKSSPFFDFTIGMIRNETGHSLKCVTLYRKCINVNAT